MAYNTASMKTNNLTNTLEDQTEHALDQATKIKTSVATHREVQDLTNMISVIQSIYSVINGGWLT